MLTAVVTLVAAACVPTTMPGADTGVVAELERTANILFHRMELGYLDSGIYTTNVLIDVVALASLPPFSSARATDRTSMGR